ncbi:MAG: DNA polymerase III subunit chi [Rhodocyclaceae bacterium]|nr:DNA polymerase III subunit chi [Rhodocyclaceae bacterium]
MTTITFHHGAQDKLAVACRLAQERFQDGRRVLVYAPNGAVADRFDHQLWSFASLSFVPHCRAASPLAAETPVVISGTVPAGDFSDVLINLATELPTGFERFREVIEVVGTTEEDAAPARLRFRHYKDCGFVPQSVRVDS